MDPAKTHTSITHLLDDTATDDEVISVADDFSTTPFDDATPPSSPPTITPISTGTTKEAGPSRSSQEVGSEQEQSEEQSAETSQENEKNKESVRRRRDIPDIHPDAAKAGLQVSPSALQFPTIYDVKVPIYKDEQILENLHKNFWTGARWLAELCKYILWQAHIRLRKVGDRIVRERIPEKF